MSRVVLVGKGAPDRGGIPTFLDTLLHSTLAAEHELRFLNVAHTGTPQAERLSPGNIGRTLRDAAAVWRAARRSDIVHVHSALSSAVTIVRAGFLAAMGRLGGCAVVIHAHGGKIQGWLNSPARRALLRAALRPAHRVVAVGTAGRETLCRVLPEERVALITNGVPVENYAGELTPHDPPRILFVGLLTPRKGVLDLLEASRLLHERGVDHELRLLGGTPDEGPEAEAQVRAALDERVRVLGTRTPEQMPEEFAAADVFCLPSWWEAMPLSILEAMASGLPVVASDVGDIPRAVADGSTGFVVPPRDPEALAAALEKLLTDPALRRRMGDAGREVAVAAFSSAAMAGQISDLYAELRPGHS